MKFSKYAISSAIGRSVHYIGEHGQNIELEMECDGITYDMLRKIGDLFGTEKISLVDPTTEGGCDTCGHGSRTTVTVSIVGGSWPTDDD